MSRKKVPFKIPLDVISDGIKTTIDEKIINDLWEQESKERNMAKSVAFEKLYGGIHGAKDISRMCPKCHWVNLAFEAYRTKPWAERFGEECKRCKTPWK